jgi:heme-degrading monooxygenase HmoA
VGIYTVGVWTVEPGREDEFVALWRELGEWTLRAFPDATGTLLRNRDVPNKFVSFGPWDSLETIDRWRSSPEWQDVVGKMRDVLESFEPGTYDLAVHAS